MPLIRISRNRISGIVALGGLAYLLVRCCEFLYDSGYPSGYWGDLGNHLIATAYQAQTIRSFGDLLDCIGWSAWGDVPQFSYNPMTTSAVLVSLVKLGASPLFAVKFLIVAQIWMALLSMAYLYRTTRRSWAWALAAGLIYALLPATAMQVSTNLDLGFSVALAPLALAFALRLIRRFGTIGLPLAGAICGAVGEGFSTEYLLVVSFPLYAAIALVAYSNRRRTAWTIAAVGGLVSTVGIGLFCILPSFASNALLSSPASRVAEVEDGRWVALFGETITSLWHGVLTESTLSPVPEFNVRPLLWSTSIALTILWCAGFAYAVRRFRRGGSPKRLAVCVALLLFLAFGSAVPFGATFWIAVGHFPILQLLRTPDRLVIVPFVFVVWWSVAMLESWQRASSKRLLSPRRLAVFAPLLAIISFAFFDYEAGVLLVRSTVDYRLPALAETNAVAIRQTPPVAAYTFVNQGAFLDTPLYGLGAPTRVIAQDLISRYGTSPGHAIGMLRKAGIRSLITTPLWASDVAGWPDLGATSATSRWVRGVFGSPAGPAVWQLKDPSPNVSQTSLACLHGGPGMLDELSLVPSISRFALAREADRCAIDIYADADPRDESLPHAIASWSGASLSPLKPVSDRDYTFFTSRSLLARPWYRDAIEGDSPAFGRPAAPLDNAWHGSLIANVPARGHYFLNVRQANGADSCVVAKIEDRSRESVERCAPAGIGLHWISLPCDLDAGMHTISIAFEPAPGTPSGTIVLDGIALVRDPGIEQQPRPSRPSIAVYSVAWSIAGGHMRPMWLGAGHYRVSWFSSDGSLINQRATIDGRNVDRVFTSGLSRYHVVGPAPVGADLLMFSGDGTQRFVSPRAIGQKRSATTWDVTLESSHVVRATVLNDRSWSLDSRDKHFEGFDCDIVDTCFGDVPPGRYVLHHRWPPAVIMGLLASLATWLVSASICVGGRRRLSSKRAL